MNIKTSERKIELIDHTNKKWFWTHLNTESEVEEVRKYLLDNNLKIKIISSSGVGYDGIGTNVILEDIDLSGNGFCFKGENLLTHVRYFRALQEIATTDDFKIWLDKYELFDLVKRYIIEKDQRWINGDKISELNYF